MKHATNKRKQATPAESGQRLHRNFRLRPELAAQLEQHAAATRRSKTAIVEMALEQHLAGGAK